MATVTIPTIRKFRDLDLSFISHPIRKDVNVFVNEYAIINSVKNLVLTNFYERPFRPEIGSNIRRLLFENFDVIVSTQIEKALQETIAPKALSGIIKHAATVDAPAFVGADVAVRKLRGEQLDLGQEAHTAAFPIVMNVAMGLFGKAFGGGKYLFKDMPYETKLDILTTVATQDPQTVEPMIQQAVEKGVMNLNEANDFRKSVADVKSVVDALPSDVSPETFKEVIRTNF